MVTLDELQQAFPEKSSKAAKVICFTIPQVAELLKLAPRSVWRLIYGRRIETCTVGTGDRSRRITLASLQAYLESTKVPVIDDIT